MSSIDQIRNEMTVGSEECANLPKVNKAAEQVRTDDSSYNAQYGRDSEQDEEMEDPKKMKGSIRFQNHCKKFDQQTAKRIQLEHQSAQTNSNYALILIFLAALVKDFGWTPYYTATSIQKNENSEEILWKGIKTLEGQFKKQDPDTFLNIFAAINSTLVNDNPTEPSTIIIATREDPSNFALCFSKRVGQMINDLAKSFTVTDSSRAPLELHKSDLTSLHHEQIMDKVKAYLDEGKAVVVRDIDKIQTKEMAYVFHALCDNDEAVDTRATFIFLLPPKAAFMDDDIYTFFENAWSNTVPTSIINPLVTRMGKFIIHLDANDSC